MQKKSSSIPLYITFLFVSCLTILIGNAYLLFQNVEKLKNNNDWVEHTWDVKDKLKNIGLLIMDSESSLRGYFMSGNVIYLGPFETARNKLKEDFNYLEKKLQDNPVQAKNLTELRKLYDKKANFIDTSIEIYKQYGLAEILSLEKIAEGRQLMDEMRLVEVIMENEENDALLARRERFFAEYKDALFIGTAINAIAILVLILFYRLIYRSFNKQRRVEDTLKIINETLESTVLKRTEQLSDLSRHLLNIAEEEKANLARELHDEIGSSLTAISMDLSDVIDKLKLTEPALTNQLQRAKRVVLDTVDLKRRIIEGLRPSTLDNLGLATSINHYCEETTAMAGLKYVSDISEDLQAIDSSWSIALFRITQESLNNTIKYAKASEVKVSLKCKYNGLWLQIVDDGIGIPRDAINKTRAHGLLGMRERVLLLGGTFNIRPSDYQRGTTVEAFIPFATDKVTPT